MKHNELEAGKGMQVIPSSPASRSSPPLKWAAEVAPVKEITLHGLADLGYWQDRLRGEDLLPTPLEGAAQVFLSATETRFWGILFRECILGVQVSRSGAGNGEAIGMFLVHAWNSVRFFAWVERTMFQTPYHFGQLEVESGRPARFQVGEQGTPLILAEQGGSAEPASVADEAWQGPIFLPRSAGRPSHLFIAQLNGLTEHYTFDPEHDKLKLTPGDQQPSLRSLLDSKFTPKHWHIRQAAAHAKSKTYRTSAWFGE